MIKSEIERGALALKWLAQQNNGNELLSTLNVVLKEQSNQQDPQSTVDIELRGVAQRLCLERGLSEYFANTLAGHIVTYVQKARAFTTTNPIFPGEQSRFLQ